MHILALSENNNFTIINLINEIGDARVFHPLISAKGVYAYESL